MVPFKASEKFLANLLPMSLRTATYLGDAWQNYFQLFIEAAYTQPRYHSAGLCRPRPACKGLASPRAQGSEYKANIMQSAQALCPQGRGSFFQATHITFSCFSRPNHEKALECYRPIGPACRHVLFSRIQRF
jgi:hypothetical protein